MNSFDYQLSRFTDCPYPRGIIRACFPTSSELSKYSILDFDNGATLYNLGKTSNECRDIPLCE